MKKLAAAETKAIHRLRWKAFRKRLINKSELPDFLIRVHPRLEVRIKKKKIVWLLGYAVNSTIIATNKQ